MLTKFKENREFAKCLRDWIAVIQQNRASIEHTPPQRTARAARQEHSDGGHFGPKRAPSGRYDG